MCQCEGSVAPSDHPDGNMDAKGTMFFYLVAICSLNRWWSSIIWSCLLLDCLGGGFLKCIVVSQMGATKILHRLQEAHAPMLCTADVRTGVGSSGSDCTARAPCPVSE